MKSQKGCYVYFYYNENDILLYVGLSNDVGQRFKTHIGEEKWMSEVEKIGVRQYQNSTSMKLCEKYYIAKLKPKYNIKDTTKDHIEINFSDPAELELMPRHKFIDKYCESKKVRKKRITFKEKLMNLNCNIIRTNTINLFDESLLRYYLDETVFQCEDSLFYFNADILKDKNKNLTNPIINSKITKIKTFLNNEERVEEPLLIGNIMPFILYYNSPKSTGGLAIISSMQTNKERIVTEIEFSGNLCFVPFKNHLIINFDKLI